MAELQLALHRAKTAFNADVESLRARKRTLVQALRSAEDEIAAIDAEVSTGAVERLLEAAKVQPEVPKSLQAPDIAGWQLPPSALQLHPEEKQDFVPLTEVAARYSHAATGPLPPPTQSSSPTENSNALPSPSTSIDASPRTRPASSFPMAKPLPIESGATDGNTMLDPHATVLDLNLRFMSALPLPSSQLSTSSSAARWTFKGFEGVAAAAGLAGPPSPEEVDWALTVFHTLGDRKAWLRGQQMALVEDFDNQVRVEFASLQLVLVTPCCRCWRCVTDGCSSSTHQWRQSCG
jgi:hypothetical protein